MHSDYPKRDASSVPSSGRLFFEYLDHSLGVAGYFLRQIEMDLQDDLIHSSNSAFRGATPIGDNIEICTFDESGKETIVEQKITQAESRLIQVKDLAVAKRKRRDIPKHALSNEIVFDPCYGIDTYNALPKERQETYEKPGKWAIGVMNAEFVNGKKKFYSERDAENFLNACIRANSPRMFKIYDKIRYEQATPAFLQTSLSREGSLDALQKPGHYEPMIDAVMPEILYAWLQLGNSAIGKKYDLFNLNAHRNVYLAMSYMQTNFSVFRDEDAEFKDLQAIIDDLPKKDMSADS